MARRALGKTVFDAALDRMVELYSEGHRIIVSFSAGKDSGVCLEVCILAASITNRLPVEVIMRDEEIMFPGTFEYAERMANRPEIDFHWIYANQPIINIFNREKPYWWVFDPLLPPDQLVRQPPARAYKIAEQNIQGMITPDRFPPAPGKKLFTVVGLRVSESINRMRGLYASGGYTTVRPNDWGVYYARPIYDWADGDIWKAIRDNKWDYNEAYDVMHRLGVDKNKLRIAPPTMTAASTEHLPVAMRAWPVWFDKVCQRLPGIRTAANFGRRAISPLRRIDESWQQCFQRTCIDEAPPWIASRADTLRREALRFHNSHSTEPFPDVALCPKCGQHGSWKQMSNVIYNGDPFLSRLGSQFQRQLPYVEPEFFRPGSGTWGGGNPAF